MQGQPSNLQYYASDLSVWKLTLIATGTVSSS